jgi:HK97 family phage portal protein
LVAIGRKVRNATGTPVAYQQTPVVPHFTGNDAETAMRAYDADPTLFAVIDQFVTDISQHKWHLWTRAASGKDEDRTQVVSHAALDLWEQPNPFMDRVEFLENSWLHYELTYETFWVIGMSDRAAGLPLSLWPVSSERMRAVPSRSKYLAGYVYRDPDGRMVPFPVEQVIHIKKGNPRDPYTATSPIDALMNDLEASVAAARYNANFFRNSAEPGGVIEVVENLTDEEFDTLNARWNAQHRGVANSHRVAILEAGMQWKDRSFSMRDMQFTELRKAAGEQIMLAKGMSKTLLGQTEGVNRATAEAAEYVYSKYRTVPRLRKIQTALNRRLLPMYANGDRYEFDFESPVTGNVEDEAKDRDSRIAAAWRAIKLGADPAAAFEAFDLPELEWSEPEPVPAQLAPFIEDEEEPPRIGPGVVEDRARVYAGFRWPHRPRNVDDPPDLDPAELPDVRRLQTKFDAVLDGLLADWAGLEETAKAALVAQVLSIAQSGSIADLERLTVDTDAMVVLLMDAMADIAEDAADAVVEEAAAQGVRLQPAVPSRFSFRDVAVVVAALVTARLVGSAKSNAMRANSSAASPSEVADAVRLALGDLSVDGPRPQLSSALTGTQNQARIETLARGPVGAVYASEVNDSNTCGPCREVDGRWLGNTDELDQVMRSYPGGAYGGYVGCEGRERCRGTITGVWRR